MRNHIQKGWGNTHSSESVCFKASEFSPEVRQKFQSGLAVGFGRSYGDSSINSDGIYFEADSNKQIEINQEEMFALCGANASIGDLERAAIAKGFFPITVPGTEFVSIGGAIASNIHGKSHHNSGSFGESVLEIEILTSTNKILILSPNGQSADFFWATVGGMGLTGVITRAKLRLSKIETSYALIEEKRAKNLKELLDLIRSFDKKYHYTVAWIDLSGQYVGRGKVIGGNHAKITDLRAAKTNAPLAITEPAKISVPKIFPSWFISNLPVRIFNYIYFKKPPQKGLKHVREFLHPLDSAKNWNNIYGKSGLIQFQFQIPYNEEDFFYKVFNVLRENNVASFLGVLKSFGPSDPSLLGFPSPGWTLAVDFPAKRIDLIPEIQNLIEELIKINGRVYLTKDSILRAEDFNKMYSRIPEWKAIKNEIDPDNFWRSDQGRRLGLC
jgi:decaprenylphospho-beta-D-ribofuranose 2-oxidase